MAKTKSKSGSGKPDPVLAASDPVSATASVPEPKPAPKEVKSRWRVSVDLIPPDVDFVFAADTQADALSSIRAAFTAGYVTRDRRHDSSNYELEVIPITRVRSFKIHEIPEP